MLITQVTRRLDKWLVYCSAALDVDFCQVKPIFTLFYMSPLKSLYCYFDEKVYVEVKVRP